MRFVLFTFCLHFLLRRHVYFFGDLVPWLSFSKFLSSPAPPFSSTSTRFFLVCSRTLVMSFFLRYTSSDSLFSNFSPSNFFRKKFACWRRDGSNRDHHLKIYNKYIFFQSFIGVAQKLCLPRPFEVWISKGCGRLNFWATPMKFWKNIYFT